MHCRKSSGGGNGNPLQYCLKNPMDGGAWEATVEMTAESDVTEQRSKQRSIKAVPHVVRREGNWSNNDATENKILLFQNSSCYRRKFLKLSLQDPYNIGYIIIMKIVHYDCSHFSLLKPKL